MFESFVCCCGFVLLFMFTALVAIFYQLVLRYWSYFTDQNVKFVRGIPLLGTAYKSILGIEPVAISYRRCYERFPTEKFIGIYSFCGRPSHLIRDADLVKQILVTDADYFVNHVCKFGNPNTLFGIEDATWRCAVSPALSGSGLRKMHALMVNTSVKFVKTLKETDKTTKLFDSRDLFMRFANDLVASAIFGKELNSIRNDNNEIFKAAYALSDSQYIDGVKFLTGLNCPSFIKFLDVVFQMTGKNHHNILRLIANEAIESGKQANSNRNDLINLLIKANEGQLHNDEHDDNVNIGFAATEDFASTKCTTQEQQLTVDDMIAQCVKFFLGSLNLISTTSCFMFHELALNPDIQSKLFSEIESIKKQLNGSVLTYEMIQKLKYLDMVVCETLRRWPSIPFFQCSCNHSFTLENIQNTKSELQIGDSVTIPIYALHMDEKYFSKPIKFDPERFNDENRGLIRSGTYLPFGISPCCIVESKFALLAIKTLTFHLLAEFFIDISYKTPDPLKLKALPLQMDAENGFFIELRRRDPDRTPYKSQVFT